MVNTDRAFCTRDVTFDKQLLRWSLFISLKSSSRRTRPGSGPVQSCNSTWNFRDLKHLKFSVRQPKRNLFEQISMPLFSYEDAAISITISIGKLKKRDVHSSRAVNNWRRIAPTSLHTKLTTLIFVIFTLWSITFFASRNNHQPGPRYCSIFYIPMRKLAIIIKKERSQLIWLSFPEFSRESCLLLFPLSGGGLLLTCTISFTGISEMPIVIKRWLSSGNSLEVCVVFVSVQPQERRKEKRTWFREWSTIVNWENPQCSTDARRERPVEV